MNQQINSNLTNYIIQLAQQPNAKDSLNLLLDNLFNNSQKEKAEEDRKNKATSSIVFFTTKELSTMPKQFRKLFKTNKVRAHVRKRADGLYEIRCMIDLKPITAVSKYLETAKEKFIEKLKNVAAIEVQVNISDETDFCTYIEQWMETAKKPHVKESTYKDYIQTVKTNIEPAFQDRTLESLAYSELQAFITKYQDDGKNRTAKKIYQLLSSLFDAAVADRLVPISPMLKVKLAHYETESGVPFTREEERQLLEDFKREPTLYRQAFVFMLYTGVRRAELSSVVVENGWIHLVTAKQRRGLKRNFALYLFHLCFNKFFLL